MGPRGEGDFVLALTPGDRVTAWPKMRALLGVNRRPEPTWLKGTTGKASP